MFDKMKALWKARELWKWYQEGGLERMNTSNLGSRKLWTTIAGMVGATALGVMGGPAQVADSLRWLVVTYLGGQSAVDLSGGARTWKSKKLWVTIGTSVLITVLAQMGVEPKIIEVINWFARTYLMGQSAVDLMKARKGNSG